MSKTTKLLLGVLGAAAAGVAVGILLAPDKGSETRKKIGEKAKDWRDQVKDLISAGKEYLDEAAETIATEAGGLKDDAEKRYSKAKSDLS